MGIPNLFAGAIAALDPGRNTSRLEFEHFALSAPYIPGHFRGDRIWAAIAAEDLRVHAGDMDTQANFVALPLIRVSERLRGVRLEFGFGVFADVSREQFARQKDNRSWQVEFPPEALRVL